jgi:hypothetical protein
MWLVPLVILINLLIIYLQFRNLPISMLVFTEIPTAFAGGMILLALAGTEMNTAVWVGFIALFGIAVDDGVVMATYLDQMFKRRRLTSVHDIRDATRRRGIETRPALLDDHGDNAGGAASDHVRHRARRRRGAGDGAARLRRHVPGTDHLVRRAGPLLRLQGTEDASRIARPGLGSAGRDGHPGRPRGLSRARHGNLDLPGEAPQHLRRRQPRPGPLDREPVAPCPDRSQRWEQRELLNRSLQWLKPELRLDFLLREVDQPDADLQVSQQKLGGS